MAFTVSVSFHNDNPDTIWNRLAAKLGRQPSNAEAAAEVRRILAAATAELASDGRLPYQRRR